MLEEKFYNKNAMLFSGCKIIFAPSCYDGKILQNFDWNVKVDWYIFRKQNANNIAARNQKISNKSTHVIISNSFRKMWIIQYLRMEKLYPFTVNWQKYNVNSGNGMHWERIEIFKYFHKKLCERLCWKGYKLWWGKQY